jgi:hypothetical protein
LIFADILSWKIIAELSLAVFSFSALCLVNDLVDFSSIGDSGRVTL